MSEDKKFFYQGTYYFTEEEFIDGVDSFNKRIVDETSVDSLLTELTSCIKINLEIHEPKMTNSMLRFKLEKIFIYAIKELFTGES
jgi:hypothetical protein